MPTKTGSTPSLSVNHLFQFTVTGAYPLAWNAHQDWKYSLTACISFVCFVVFHLTVTGAYPLAMNAHQDRKYSLTACNSFVCSVVFQLTVTGAYPLAWNAHQDWKYSLTACKSFVSVYSDRGLPFGMECPPRQEVLPHCL